MRLGTQAIGTQAIDFNPRTREECDSHKARRHMAARNFNPRTREECDMVIEVICMAHDKFQSTHSRGVRHLEAKEKYGTGKISIHALARSATS